MRELSIAGRRIADDTDGYVIAEIGANHMGSVETCKEIIRAAALCGVDAVKLQKRDLPTWEALDPDGWHAPYHSENAFGPTYGLHRAALEFGWEEYRELQRYAGGLRVAFFATAFDVPSLHFLVDLGVPAVKLASASIVNEPLLQAVARTGLPTIASTGGATLGEIERGVHLLRTVALEWDERLAHPPLALLQCTATYPCEAADMGLRVIETLRGMYPWAVCGLSDHQSGIAMAPVAYTLGSRIFEKHFTLHRAWKGSDQAFSLEPEGMRRMVRDLRRTREALGDGVKRRLPAEVPALVKMGRRDLLRVPTG